MLRMENTQMTVDLSKYRVKATAYERYYDMFCQNYFQRRQFKVVLVTGEEVSGTPTARWRADETFLFEVDAGTYRVPFADLSSAEEVKGKVYVATEREWLIWFAQHADFGPAHGDVMAAMRDAFELETGREVPPGWRGDE